MNDKSEDKAKKTTQNIASKPDALVKGGGKGKVELTEEDLSKATGGAAFIKFDSIKGP